MQSLLSQAILSAVALAVTAQIPLCPYHAHLTEELRNCHGPELSSNEAFNTLSEFSKRCADKQFNRLFYRCWADMLRSDYSLNSAGVDNHDLAVFKKSLDCQFHVLEIEP
ncbi:hypothetical protein MRX96_046911 [Rhipicephalus microplus]